VSRSLPLFCCYAITTSELIFIWHDGFYQIIGPSWWAGSATESGGKGRTLGAGITCGIEIENWMCKRRTGWSGIGELKKERRFFGVERGWWTQEVEG